MGDAVTSQGRELVLVLGPGRSGTSTMAGALARTGFQVPDALDGDDSNPTGFYEPAWAVDFHTRLLERVCVHTLDGDPAAYDELAKVLADPEPGAELTDWLATELAAHPRLVIKDPRLVWFRDLWVTAAQSAGVSPAFVVMLRHPAEVSSSRSEFYDAPQGTAVAGWINVVLLTERLTRGSRRAFVTYADLLTDWRPVLSTMSARLDLHLDPAPDVSTHPIDEFIDPGAASTRTRLVGARRARLAAGSGRSDVRDHHRVGVGWGPGLDPGRSGRTRRGVRPRARRRGRDRARALAAQGSARPTSRRTRG
ncbi:MAG: hypothetical protein V9G04_01215 [Nocardioides sp.]